MTLRIAFDLDGVLADLGSAFSREERRLFGSSSESSHALPPGEDQPVPASGKESGAERDQLVAEMTKHGLAARQRRVLWQTITTIENFWETLGEIEAGSVESIARLAATNRWEVLFLTKRPATAGSTPQVQTQRWLQHHGFPLPSVFVVNGSRGKIADALDLDIVVDDLPVNCVDVLSDSKAKAILVWRDSFESVSATAQRLGIGVVSSVEECLDVLVAMDEYLQRLPTPLDRVKWALGLTARK